MAHLEFIWSNDIYTEQHFLVAFTSKRLLEACKLELADASALICLVLLESKRMKTKSFRVNKSTGKILCGNMSKTI